MEEYENKLILEKFFSRRPKPLAETTKKKYLADLNIYSNYQGITLKELVDEAKEEQRTRIIDNVLYECDIENSKLSERLEDFFYYEKNRGIAPLTLDTRINNIRAFYRGMGVKTLPMKINNPIETHFTLLPKEKITRSLKYCNPLNKAMITFLASTGIRISDCANFTINNYIESMQLNDLDELVELIFHPKLHDEMVGYWEFRPQKTKTNICQVCNTPESNKHILSYLQGRYIKHGLDEDEQLFLTNRQTKITNTYFAYICQRINWKLTNDETKYWQQQTQLGIITEKERVKKIENMSKFHAHGLRKYFISTISSMCGNLRILLLMEGHRSIINTDNSYVRINRETIVNEYLRFIPSLSFEPTTVNVLTDKRIIEYENRLKEQQDRLDTLEEFVDKLKEFPL